MRTRPIVMLAVAALAAVLVFVYRQPPAPQRSVPDPGVIATGQRVTPAGGQSVFRGRVGGVRFGANAAEVWVAVPGALYRLDWRANRALATAAFDGRPGAQGVVFDAATGRALVATVGRLPAGLTDSRLPGERL